MNELVLFNLFINKIFNYEPGIFYNIKDRIFYKFRDNQELRLAVKVWKYFNQYNYKYVSFYYLNPIGNIEMENKFIRTEEIYKNNDILYLEEIPYDYLGNDDYSNYKNEYESYGNIVLWNTVNITDMSELFSEIHFFNENIDDWNLGKVKNFKDVFKNCINLKYPLKKWEKYLKLVV